MARSKPTNPTVPTIEIKLSQQALNVVRQTVNAIGWATTISELTTGGDLLKVLPRLDPTDWVRSEEQILKMDAEEQAAYLKRDVAWGSKEVVFTLTAEQKEAAAKAVAHWMEAALKAKKLAPAGWLTELIEQFDIKPNDSAQG